MCKITTKGRNNKDQVETRSPRRNRLYTKSAMAAVIYFGLALFILTSFVVQVDSNFQQYKSVVSDVHEYYSTSSIFFVIPRNNWSLKDYSSVHSMSREFSRKYDFTSIIYFDQLDEHTRWYHKRIGRPLLVISLRSMTDIAEFSEKFTNESYIWLVIFTNAFGSSALCDYCNSPNGNSFRLRFDTEMLVLCCDSLILKEWWSLNGDHTEVSDFAFWTDENRDKPTFLAPASMELRRHDLKGAAIRVGFVEGSSYAYEVGDEIRGFFGEILVELKRSMNFTITEIVRSPEYGIWNSKTNSWTGIIGRVVQREVDLGVAQFLFVNDRVKVVEYTSPLALAKNKLYFRDQEEDAGVNWTAYFQVFLLNIWIATIVLINLASMLQALIKVFKSSRSLSSLIVECYLNVWGIFCQQGLCEFPAETSLRVAYFSIFILALVFSAAYSAALVSFLTISPSSLPFTTLEGYVKDGSYRLIVLGNTAQYGNFANSTRPTFKEMMKLMKPIEELPKTVAAGWEQVCQEKVAFYTSYIPRNTSCNITAIDSGYGDSVAMIMPTGSQYRRAINFHLQRFKDNGVMDHIKRNYYDSTSTTGGATFDEFNLLKVMPLLAILTLGIMLALLVLLGEVTYNALRTNSRSK